MHQIKRTTNFATTSVKNIWNTSVFYACTVQPLTACSFVRECSLGKLEKGEAGEIDWVSLLFYTCRLFLSQMCEIFILSWLGILKFETSQWLCRFLTIFWRVLNIAKNVWRCSGKLSELPKLFKSDNFSLFWSRYGTKSLFSAFIHCRYSIFSGVVDNNSIRTQKYRSMQLLIVTE